MTRDQYATIHIAQKALGLDDEQYRLLLINAGKVRSKDGRPPSSKDLTERGFEDVMAVMEDGGFRQPGKPENYYRAKVAHRSTQADPRQEHLIRELYDQYAQAEVARGKRPLFLTSWVTTISRRRTADVTKLYPREASHLIELLKDKLARAQVAPVSPPASPEPALTAAEIPF